jgi:hypothetical protein
MPAIKHRPIHQSILQPRRFLVPLNLLHRGLADVHHRQTIPVPMLDFVRHRTLDRQSANRLYHCWIPRPGSVPDPGEALSAKAHEAPRLAGSPAASAKLADWPRSSRDPSHRTSARSASRPSLGGPVESLKLSAASRMGYRVWVSRHQGPALRHGDGIDPCQHAGTAQPPWLLNAFAIMLLTLLGAAGEALRNVSTTLIHPGSSFRLGTAGLGSVS